MLQECYHNEIDEKLRRDTFVLISVAEDIDELFYASEASINVMKRGAMTIQHLKGTFSKEISKRPAYDAEPAVSQAALACKNHAFVGEQLGGLKCQICLFETNSRVWKCTKKGCDIALCGSCQDKWRKKIG